MTDQKIDDPRRFEQSMQELEALVDQLEQGDLTLEQSLAAFERGIKLTRTCQQALDAAEQRVRILTERSETADTEPFPDHGIPSRPAGDAEQGAPDARDE